jgi:hypothetical protein
MQYMSYYPVNESAKVDRVEDFIRDDELPDFVRDEIYSGVYVTFYFVDRKFRMIMAETTTFKYKFEKHE